MTRERLAAFVALARPSTLLLPAVGIASGALTGSFATQGVWSAHAFGAIALASAAAAALNAASNALNQVYDLDVDRVNKPDRPLPRNRLTTRDALAMAAVGYVLAVGAAFAVSPWTGALFAVGALSTLVYSVPLLGRTKRSTWASNLTIAVPRGCLLKVAGWSVCAPVDRAEPWYLGAVFALFLLGATTSKDFSDLEGDRRAGCITLPVRVGPLRAARWIAPFFVFPWLLLPLGAVLPDPFGHRAHLLSAPLAALGPLALVLAAWGAVVARSILRDPAALVGRENHPAWTSMYAMAVLTHVGIVLAYAS
jgi:4-hydroxybenzoate polyprenyltransferase